MPKDKEEIYILSRGYTASSRLNLQGLLWKSLFKTSTGLHPMVDDICCPSNNTTESKQAVLFADLATGTGIQLLDMSGSVSDNVKLHGFDISPDQFPHGTFHPPNVEFFVSDATKQPAKEFKGKYDVVHIRMLNAGIDGDDPGPVLRHARGLLKEGGVLQWDEIDFWHLERGKGLATMVSTGENNAQNSLETPYLDQVVNIFRHIKQMTWISNMSQHFVNNSFTVLFDDHISLEPWKRHMLMEIWCLVTNELANTLETRGQTEQAAEIKKVVDGAYAEIRRGGYFEHLIRVVVGKKGGDATTV